MGVAAREVVAWIADEILPYEGRLRGWLLRTGTTAADADDLLHDGYARLSALTSVAEIDNPLGYVVTILRNLRRSQLRRARVVPFEALTDDPSVFVADPAADPEYATERRRQLARIDAAITLLPERCRTIFRLRRIEGIPQREIARRLGVSEGIVENDAAKGLRIILAALRAPGDALDASLPRQRRA